MRAPRSRSTAKPWSISCLPCAVSAPGGCGGAVEGGAGGGFSPRRGDVEGAGARPVWVQEQCRWCLAPPGPRGPLSPSLPPDESDPRRKEAIRAKVSAGSLGGTPSRHPKAPGGLLHPVPPPGGAVHLAGGGAEGAGHLRQQEPPAAGQPGQGGPQRWRFVFFWGGNITGNRPLGVWWQGGGLRAPRNVSPQRWPRTSRGSVPRWRWRQRPWPG